VNVVVPTFLNCFEMALVVFDFHHRLFSDQSVDALEFRNYRINISDALLERWSTRGALHPRHRLTSQTVKPVARFLNLLSIDYGFLFGLLGKVLSPSARLAMAPRASVLNLSVFSTSTNSTLSVTPGSMR